MHGGFGVFFKLRDSRMGNVAAVPKSQFSAGMGCMVFHVSGIKSYNLDSLGIGPVKR